MQIFPKGIHKQMRAVLEIPQTQKNDPTLNAQQKHVFAQIWAL